MSVASTPPNSDSSRDFTEAAPSAPLMSRKAKQMLGDNASPLQTRATETVITKPIPIELSTSQKFKQGVIKTAIVAAKSFVTIIALLVVGPIMLIGNILTGGKLWNAAMSRCFLPGARDKTLKGSSPGYLSFFEGLQADLKNRTGNGKITIPVTDKIQLQGFFLGNKDDLTRPTVIFFCQNQARFEHEWSLVRNTLNEGCNILFANYQGIGESTGGPPTCAEDLLDNGRAMIEYAIDPEKGLGLPKGNIVLYGSSIGGAVATKVAKEYPEAHLKNAHSFISWSAAAEGVVNKYSYLGTLVKVIVSDSKWDIDAMAAWRERSKIPERGFTHFDTARNDEVLNQTSRIGDKALEEEFFKNSNVESEEKERLLGQPAKKSTHSEREIGHSDSLANDSAETHFFSEVKKQIHEQAVKRMGLG